MIQPNGRSDHATPAPFLHLQLRKHSWMRPAMPPPRFAQSRTRGEQWLTLVSAVMLIVCFEQHSIAEAATIQVNTTQQGVTNGQCSLQEAIYASRFKSNTAIGSIDPEVRYTTGCIAGTRDDTIVLPAGAVFTFDHFCYQDAYNETGPTATPEILTKITIEGNGATLQWKDIWGPGNSRLFTIGHPLAFVPSLTLKNVYVKDFHIKGGNGGNGGGGGGLGAGGAIYVKTGSLTVENSTFENNGAVGGNGGTHATTLIGRGGGGGGGLAGNGGLGCEISGGGGGGSRGDGGKHGCSTASTSQGGGGGGGTLFSGADGTSTGGGAGGFLEGGKGGGVGRDGHEGNLGGGGGGGGFKVCGFFEDCYGNGAKGGLGGGGGGGAGDGGDGSFGGGGGAGVYAVFSLNGGDGGFGGGGGAVADCPTIAGCYIGSFPGKGGFGGGRADRDYGGGGGALGGAIFNHAGFVRVLNSTFFNNYVTRGVAGGGSAGNGGDAGAAIFSLNGTLEVTHSTIGGNQSTGSGGGIVYYRDKGEAGGTNAPRNFTLKNTIIAQNGANECFFTGSVTVKGTGNLIMNNGSGTGPFSPCPGVVTKSDPRLQRLQLYPPGNTPTMALIGISPAFNSADPAASLPTDQRGVTRPQDGGFDIGAYEGRIH